MAVIRGVNLYVTLGGQTLRKFGNVQAPKARSCDCRRQRGLPSGVWGRSPRNRSDFEHFMPKLGTFWDLVNLRFLTIKSKNSRLKKFLLTRSWIYETNIMF